MKLKLLIAVILIGTGCLSTDVYKPVKFSRNEVIFANSKYKINVFDPTPLTNESGSLFPGGRGANQLVIYTPDFGDRTNTNEFGTEAVVQDNIVTTLSGANSLIPEDGIVISGHGSAKNWIIKNIAIGTKVYIDKQNKVINTYTTSDSYTYEAKEKISETESMINFYKGKVKNYNYKNAETHIKNANLYIKKAKKNINNQENLKKYALLSINEANTALLTVLPNMDNEVKGVWIRPTENTETSIIATLDNMQKIGINSIFLETFYHGKTIFPSKTMSEYGFITQNEQFRGINPLKIWIHEAHKRNIKIHIWFQSFYVGNIPPSSNSILGVNPQWGNKTQNDIGSESPTRSKSEHNGYFLDPANPEVQEFLTKLITEIICDYQPDGINLDYIRYPQNISKSEAGSWGYTQYARNDFKDMYNVDPANLKQKDELWKNWENYRREKITNFVRSIGLIGHQNNTYISTVIFPDLETALNTKQQDWRTWSRREYIDGFTPLFLTYDSDMVAQMMQEINKIKAPKTDIYAGIFVTFMGGSTEDLVRQIHKTRELKADGIILFDYAHTLPDKYSNMLKCSAFNTEQFQKEKKNKRKLLFFKK